MSKQTTIAHSHDFVAASDCALYLRDNFHHLSHATFRVSSEELYQGTRRYYRWKLVFLGDLDRVKNLLDLDYANGVVGAAHAFIAGRGGIPMPSGGVVFS